METIIGCMITGGLSLVGVILTNVSSNKKVEHTLEVQQSVNKEKIEELTREVRIHNNFAQRVPVLENKVDNLRDRVTKMEDKI